MAGRTVKKWTKVYIAGYDMSGYARTIGPLKYEFDTADLTALADGVQGKLPNHPSLSVGTLKSNLDNTASGMHVTFSGAGVSRQLMVAIGMRTVPAQGDPVYCGQFIQGGYKAVEDSGAILVDIPFGDWDAGGLINYGQPWGVLLHANSAVTAVNSSTGVDGGAATTKGGWMMYQIFAASLAGHTATIKVQDAAVNENASFEDVTDLTTGEIDVGTAATSGIIAIGTTATIRQYTRWQIVLGTATSVTFALALMRGK